MLQREKPAMTRSLPSLIRRFLYPVLVSGLLASVACTVGPKYKPP